MIEISCFRSGRREKFYLHVANLSHSNFFYKKLLIKRIPFFFNIYIEERSCNSDMRKYLKIEAPLNHIEACDPDTRPGLQNA